MMIEITESKYTSSERASIYKMQKICLPSDDVCKIHKASDVWIVAKSGKQFAGFGGIRFLYDDVWYLAALVFCLIFRVRACKKD